MSLLEKNSKKKNNKDSKEDPTGIKGYIDNIVLNPNLEQDLKAIGSPYKIPVTPLPEEDDTKDGKQQKPKK